MKTTSYFDAIRSRADRKFILDKWIMQVVKDPEKTTTQTDGRIRKWGKIAEMNNRYLRVILLPDGKTIHNVFFDRGYKP